MENKKNNEFNRMEFLETVVSEFINKKTYESLKKAYDGHVYLSQKNDNAVISQEKRKILEKCFEIFNDPDFKRKIQKIQSDINPKPYTLARTTTKFISERILGDRKRKYDMSDRYSEDQITENSTKDVPLANGLKSVPLKDHHGNTITIQKIGALTFDTQSVKGESINKYKVVVESNDSSIKTFEIYSFIDLNLLEVNSEYRFAVFEELLSQNNIELSNTCGYVGEIVSTRKSTVQLSMGQQRENDEKFYRYQASENYALVYDPQDLSAVVYHSRHQELNTTTNRSRVTSKDDVDRS